MELKRYRVRLEGMDIADFDTYGEAYTFKNAYSGEAVDIFDAVTKNYIFPKFNVMNERGVIINYADSEDTAKEYAEEYQKQTGIGAVVLDNGKDYTGRPRCVNTDKGTASETVTLKMTREEISVVIDALTTYIEKLPTTNPTTLDWKDWVDYNTMIAGGVRSMCEEKRGQM